MKTAVSDTAPTGADLTVEANLTSVVRKAEDLQCCFEEADEPEAAEIAEDDPMARMPEAVARLAVSIRTTGHAQRSLKTN